MRRGEITNQIWEDIDFDRRLISVTHSKTAEGEHRLIPMTSRLHGLLANLRKPSGIVFTYEVVTTNAVDGRLVRETSQRPIHRIKTGWKGALRRAGLPHYRFHDLRHTFNSRLAEIGIIADVRKELMGHSGGGDVHSMYTHIELPTLRDAIRRLETWHAATCHSLEDTGEAKAFSDDRTLTTEKEERTSE